jgi:rhomboid protease GluP
MAAGFTPKHSHNIPLNNITKEQFLIFAIESAKKLDWEIGYISDTGLIAYTGKGMFNWKSEFKVVFEESHAVASSTSVGSEMVDWGKNKKIVDKFEAAFEELKATMPEEELSHKYEEVKASLAPEEDDILRLPPATTTEQVKDFFSIFVPTKGFFVTPILMDLNILIFILMVVSGVGVLEPTTESLINWGANLRPATLDGQLWRLISNCFIHIGILHLLMNMYALLYIGVLLEPILGRTRFISAYLLTGIIASLASLWWHDLTVSAGASGAIFGMYGLFLALLTTDLIEKSARKALLTSIAIFVGYNLINGLKGGIDNAAHIGGLLSGLVIGYAFIASLKRPEENKLKYGTIGLLSIVILFSSFVVSKTISNDIGKYDTAMKEFQQMETQALSVFSLPDNTPKEDMLYEIKSRGIYYWKENITLIDGLKNLDLPEEVQTRNKLIREYCELRIGSYELLYKSVAEDSQQYNSQLENYNKLIQNKLAELGVPPQN